MQDEILNSGFARTGRLLDREQCLELRSLYPDPANFRSRVLMSQYRFGRGEYQYFRYPLPSAVQGLRERLYAELAPAANKWAEALGVQVRYPEELSAFLERCHGAGQNKPTPLMLKYGAGDFNCLHQDVYGPVVFPFQVIIGLSDPESEYTGGELMLVEQLPRAQSKGQVLSLRQGEGVAITTRQRPARGTRGIYRVNMRHGVSPVHSGERFTLGVIFHDAE